MCGKCCKTVTTSVSYETLLDWKKQGEEGAISFLEIFEPYLSIDEAKKDSPDTVENIIKYIKDPSQLEKLTFYRCKHLLENNLCRIYNDRKELCKVFPSTPWAVVPPGCGYEGWLFQEREKIKQKIRKEKEELLSLKILLKNATPEYSEKINILIENINSHIKALSKYGSADW